VIAGKKGERIEVEKGGGTVWGGGGRRKDKAITRRGDKGGKRPTVTKVSIKHYLKQ